MAKWPPPLEISPWRRRGLTVPPDSLHAWVRLGTWEFGMGVLWYVVFSFGTHLIASAPRSIVTLNAALDTWCGLLLIAVAGWLAWDLWSAAAPRRITDDFLKLLEDSFARDWRRPRTWPWTRVALAYGFALVGVASAAGVSLLLSGLFVG